MEKKADVMGLSGEDNLIHGEAWDDRVARDLGTAYHEVGLEQYELWQKKGFGIKKEDIDLSKNEKDRLMNFMGGSALRREASIAKHDP